MSDPVIIEIPGVVKLDKEPDGLLVEAFRHSRLSSPGGSPPLRLKLDLTQVHSIAAQLEGQSYGYGAFWCRPPTVSEALWLLWSAIRGKELRMSNWRDSTISDEYECP